MEVFHGGPDSLPAIWVDACIRRGLSAGLRELSRVASAVPPDLAAAVFDLAHTCLMWQAWSIVLPDPPTAVRALGSPGISSAGSDPLHSSVGLASQLIAAASHLAASRHVTIARSALAFLSRLFSIAMTASAPARHSEPSTEGMLCLPSTAWLSTPVAALASASCETVVPELLRGAVSSIPDPLRPRAADAIRVLILSAPAPAAASLRAALSAGAPAPLPVGNPSLLGADQREALLSTLLRLAPHNETSFANLIEDLSRVCRGHAEVSALSKYIAP